MNRTISTFLVATDFSDSAAHALKWAAHIARSHDARIVLVHAIDANPTAPTALELQQQVERNLAEIERLTQEGGVEVSSEFRFGNPWEVVPSVARDVSADLLVIATRGHTTYRRLLLGSTADRVLRTSSVPVLAVHPGDAIPETGVRTVITATDFSDAAAETATTAARLVCDRPEESKVVLLHVLEPIVLYEEYGMTTAPVITEQDIEQARQSLEAIATPLREGGLTVDLVVREGYPATSIEDEARQIGADLIVVGTHGRTGLERVMLGSVAERVLHHAPCPVLSVRR